MDLVIAGAIFVLLLSFRVVKKSLKDSTSTREASRFEEEEGGHVHRPNE